MDFGFRRLKLAAKLSLLVAFPLLLSAIILAYFSRDFKEISEHMSFVAILLVTMTIFCVVAIGFVRDIVKGIKSIDAATGGLVSGSRSNGYASNVKEAQTIVQNISKAQEHLLNQTNFAEQIESGNLDATYDLRHDHDRLGRALLAIKDNLIHIKAEDQQRNWASDGLNKFVHVLQSAKNLKELSNEIIVNLVRTINANQGAIYLLVEEGEIEVLEMQACYAFSRSKHITQRITPGDGLIGQAARENRVLHVTNVPAGYLPVTSGLGQATPAELLVAPASVDGVVHAVIELGFFSRVEGSQPAGGTARGNPAPGGGAPDPAGRAARQQ